MPLDFRDIMEKSFWWTIPCRNLICGWTLTSIFAESHLEKNQKDEARDQRRIVALTVQSSEYQSILQPKVAVDEIVGLKQDSKQKGKSQRNHGGPGRTSLLTPCGFDLKRRPCGHTRWECSHGTWICIHLLSRAHGLANAQTCDSNCHKMC